jgi:hypothetical protein
MDSLEGTQRIPSEKSTNFCLKETLEEELPEIPKVCSGVS